MNNNLLLVAGKSATGKTSSFRNLKDPEGVLYLNCENNKPITFASKFKTVNITDPLQVYSAFEQLEGKDKYHTVIIDSLTFLMDQYETQYVLTATNTMKAWGDYAQYFKRLMQQYVATSTKKIIFTAHTLDVLNESEMVYDTLIKVKGSLMNNGVEAFFSHVVGAKKINIKKLESYKNDLLVITPQEQLREVKYCFQTDITKETVNERIRSPIGMWNENETFIDNDVQLVLDRIQKFYK